MTSLIIIGVILALSGSFAAWIYIRSSSREAELVGSLERAEDMFAKSFQAYPAAVVVTRLRDGEIIEANEGFETLTGHERAAIIGNTTVAAGLWEDPEDRERMLGLLKRDRRLRGFEFLGRRSTGENRLCSMSAEIFDGLDGPCVANVVEDITELRRLQRDSVEAADAERQRLARELHDGVAQELAGAGYLLQSLDQALPKEETDVRAKVAALRTLLSQAIENVRALAKGLSPVEIRHGGLEVACRRLAHEVSAVYGVDVTVNYSSALRKCDGVTKTAIYFIAREAVLNAAKHSSCRNIAISCERVANRFALSVQDDGAGIESERLDAGGMGTRLMRHRAEALSGSLLISSQLSEGTLVRCVLPCTEETDPAPLDVPDDAHSAETPQARTHQRQRP